jgi:2-amino-4-hydroxy-6-hydroxymethyldihydropteridine diphosphokinase
VKTRAFIALGSNLDDPPRRIDAAICALAELPTTQLWKRSPSYRNRAVGPRRQPDFVNAVAALITELDPYGLLDALQQIERSQGREPDAERWAPRVIDLDMLLYGDRRARDHRLTLPHPEMHRRLFVLQPLSDIAPDLEIPGRGPLPDLLKRAPAHELIRIVPRGEEVESA